MQSWQEKQNGRLEHRLLEPGADKWVIVDDLVVDCAALVVDWETGLGQAVLVGGLPTI